MEELLKVMLRTREALAHPGNDFAWSGWRDAKQALAEVDVIVLELRAGSLPAHIAVLFLPTGPIQELSVSSGWGDEFLILAADFDAALAQARGNLGGMPEP